MDSAFPSGGKDGGSIPPAGTILAFTSFSDLFLAHAPLQEYHLSMFPRISSEKDMVNIVRSYGFLPFFRSAIPGFSVEEMAESSVWFPPKGTGVWDWKNDVIQDTGAAYGKFFLSRPAFVSPDLFLVLSAYRRDGYDFEGMVNNGLVTHSERTIYSILEETDSESSTFLRYKARMSKSAFDSSNSRLQMRTFIMISGFDMKLTKDGRPYGWGTARYALPEAVYPGFEEAIDRYSNEEAANLLIEHMKSHFPDADDQDIRRLIG